MNLISTFRHQHQQLEAIAAEICERLSEEELEHAEADIRGLISGLLTKIKIHRSLEEDTVHAQLMQHHDRKVASVASLRATVSDQLFERIHRHRQRWSQVDRVGNLASVYVFETRRLLQEVIDLLHCENDEFDLVESGDSPH